MRKRVIAVFMLTFCLAACGSKEQIAFDEQKVTDVESGEIVLEEEPVISEEIVLDENEEVNADKDDADDGMEAWLVELGKQGICMAVWNEENETAHVIEEGETYVRMVGDQFFICTPSVLIETSYFTEIGFRTGKHYDNYTEVNWGEFQGRDEIKLEFLCKGGEEGELNFVMTTSEETVIAGYDWAQSLSYEYPQFVVWNDTNGLKLELEKGATYQLCVDDEVALYMPDNYLFWNASIDESYVIRGFNIAIPELDKVEMGDEFELEITIMHTDTFEEITTGITLLPLQ